MRTTYRRSVFLLKKCNEQILISRLFGVFSDLSHHKFVCSPAGLSTRTSSTCATARRGARWSGEPCHCIFIVLFRQNSCYYLFIDLFTKKFIIPSLFVLFVSKSMSLSPFCFVCAKINATVSLLFCLHKINLTVSLFLFFKTNTSANLSQAITGHIYTTVLLLLVLVRVADPGNFVIILSVEQPEHCLVVAGPTLAGLEHCYLKRVIPIT